MSSKRIGDRVQLRKDLHKTHGDYYSKMNSLWCVITTLDGVDEDGETVYGAKTGRESHFTITESMIR